MSLHLEIATDQLARLRGELVRAHHREIGGVLVGEHLGGDRFRLVAMSVQRRGGGRARFRRDPVAAARFVEDTIEEAGGDATRFNYLGEWHSHPGMSASPSATDLAQMQTIVDDPAEIATFAVLTVVSWRPAGLELSATLFRAGSDPEPIEVGLAGAIGWTQVSSATCRDGPEVDRAAGARTANKPLVVEGGCE